MNATHSCCMFGLLLTCSDDRFIALATSDRGVLIVDSFYPTRELALLQEHAYDPLQPSTISFSPDGHFLAVG